MNKLRLSIALSVGLFGCLDAGDSDSTTNTSEAQQDLNFSIDCATGSTANAGLEAINAGDTYTRHASTINQAGTNDCNCLNWEIDKNANGTSHANRAFPNCRPNTIGEVSLGFGAGYDLRANVDSWNLTNGQTECLNSTFHVRFLKFNSATSKFEVLPGGAPADQSPQWINGACQPVGAVLQVIGGPDDFEIEATATRGLGTKTFEHGFEAIRLSVNPDDIISG